MPLALGSVEDGSANGFRTTQSASLHLRERASASASSRTLTTPMRRPYDSSSYKPGPLDGCETARSRLQSGVMADSIDLPTVPFALSPSTAEIWRFDAPSGALTVTAAPRTDIFTDPAGPSSAIESMLNAATLLGLPPAGDFQLSARVTVDFAATFDAGVLLLWGDKDHWGKLCFEFSPAGEPMVVSVVTRGVSDDANAFAVTDRSIWLRVSRIDHTYAYHASTDGNLWRMIRYFTINDDVEQHRIGFEGQSPTGEGCAASFDEIRFARDRLRDMRDGS